MLQQLAVAWGTAVVNQAASRRLGPSGFHPHALVFAYELQCHPRYWLRGKGVRKWEWSPDSTEGYSPVTPLSSLVAELLGHTMTQLQRCPYTRNIFN